MKRRSARLLSIGIVLTAASLTHAQTKLNYKQEQDLKDTVFYLDEVENITTQIADALGKWKPGDASVPINQVKARIEWKEQAVKKLGYAEERLKRLPEHEKVKPERARAVTQKSLLVEQEKKLNEINEKLTGVVNQGEGEAYKADFDRLREINQMFANEQIIQTHPDKAIEIIKQISAVKTERARIAEKYADLLKQPTNTARDMNGVLRYFDEVFGRFDNTAQAFRQQAPSDIDARMNKIMEMGKTAVENNRPGYFGPTGGIASELENARVQIALLSAFDPNAPVAKDAAAKLEDTKKKVAQIGKDFETAVINSNRVPDEQYSGPDKQELIALIKDKFAKEGTGGEVLKVGMNSQGWSRDTRWEWNNSGWYKIDKSRTQGFVVYKLNEEMAAVTYIWISKDHLSNDRISTYFWDDVKTEPAARQKILLKNVK